MNLNRELPWKSALGGLVLGLITVVFGTRSSANVYASNVRINDGITNFVSAPGDPITITYILNEQASLGATVQIQSGATVVQTLEFPPGVEGTLRGFNSVNWEVTNLASGTYSVSVTAASSGYTNWTELTSDTTDLNTYVFDGRGIAVDKNPASAYYGRIFVANSSPGQTGAAGDSLGILKFNADTSDAEEGISSSGLDGHLWSDQSMSPWKLAVSSDDYVYVDDLANNGDIYRWDPTISSNSILHVLRQDNQPHGSVLSGPAITGTGAGTQLWMVDTNTATVLKWSVTPNFVCASNDTGRLVVVSTASNLFDVALDKNGNIYGCAWLGTSGDPAPRVFRYPAYDPSTNSNMPEGTPSWAVGGGDDTYAGASGIAVDPTGTYVAVAFEGPAGPASTNGNTKILWATNGALVANLDLGVINQGFANHDDTDCGWDAVGNVYYIDNYFERWHIFSPPGTNQATTAALATIQISGGPPPPSGTIQITLITVSSGNINIDFTAGTNDTASSFTVLGAATVSGPYTKLATATVTELSPGHFHATFPLGPGTQYFRISGQGTAPPSQPAFTNVVVSGGNIVLRFSGSSSDTASSFNILSAPVVNGSYALVPNAQVTQVSPGVFQTSVPKSGPAQFYRVRR
jgi:hypothetical protein